MAEYINMQQTEYDELQNCLRSLHGEVVKAEQEIRDQILVLVDYDGGLYVKGISAIIIDVLLNMSLTAKSLRNDFDDSEQAVAAFIASVIEADVTST